jgi:hypothetical protein
MTYIAGNVPEGSAVECNACGERFPVGQRNTHVCAVKPRRTSVKWIMRVQTHAGIVVTSTPMSVGGHVAEYAERIWSIEPDGCVLVQTCEPVDGEPPQVVLVPKRDIALVELRHANLTDVSAGETTELVPGIVLRWAGQR